MEFTSLENAEIVIPTGNFSPATIATLWILNEVDIKKVARIEKLPENLDKKIIKLGFEREETLEIRDNNIAYGTAGLLWKRYGTQICVKNNTRKEHIICSEIDKRIIGTIDFGVRIDI